MLTFPNLSAIDTGICARLMRDPATCAVTSTRQPVFRCVSAAGPAHSGHLGRQGAGQDVPNRVSMSQGHISEGAVMCRERSSAAAKPGKGRGKTLQTE